MRELRGADFVKVSHVPTELNPADLFTKVLSRQEFEKHRRVILNLPAAEAVARLAYEKRAQVDGDADKGGHKAACGKKKKTGYKA